MGIISNTLLENKLCHFMKLSKDDYKTSEITRFSKFLFPIYYSQMFKKVIYFRYKNNNSTLKCTTFCGMTLTLYLK